MSEGKRKQKARRSSILKPPKPRNPLSDVDLNPPTDITIKSRRVSFANVHFKKEFSSDPEKNTIWHNSYEEEMNKSDKSDLSEVIQQVSCSNEDINRSIRFVSDESDDKTDLSPCNNEEDLNMSVQDMSIDSDIFNRTQLGNLGMDLPVEIGPQNKRKTILFNQMPEDEQNMEVTHTIYPISIQNNIKTNRQTIIFNKESENLDITKQFTTNLKENMPISHNKMNIENENTGKITQVAQISKGSSNRKTIYFQSGSMDTTECIIADHKVNQENVTLEIKGNKPTHKKSGLQHQQPANEINMEMTENITTKTAKSKRRTIMFNEMEEVERNMDITQNMCTNFQYNEMENVDITASVPRNVLQKLHQQKYSVEKPLMSHETILYNQLESHEQDIEITQNIIPNLSQSKKEKNPNTIYFTEQNTENVDITKSVPRSLMQKLNQQKYLLGNKPLTSNETISYNQLEACEQDMEITQNVFPSLTQITKQTNRNTIHFTDQNTENIEITESVPQSIIQKLNQQKHLASHETILYNQLEACVQDMEFTQNILPNLSQIMKQKNRNTIHFTEQNTENVDITESVPCISIQKQKILVENKENIYSTCRIKNIPHSASQKEEQNMEIEYIHTDENKKLKSRQTIHFNETITDITENIPYISIKKQNLPAENKENESAMYQTKPTTYDETQKEVHNTELRENIQNNEKLKERQTIYFNASNLEAMDVTKSVPFNLVHQNLHVVDKENVQNMEVIQNIATSNVQNNHKQKSRQTIHFNETITDITENIPYISIKKQNLLAENKENESALYQTKPTTYDETQKEVHNTELRENIQKNEKIKERQTIYFNASNLEAMDVTKSVPFNLVHQNLPVVDKENVQNMEVIRNIATSNVQNNHKLKNRQTIHFNESITDITESVPYICIKKQNLPAENKENESAMYQTKPTTYDETQKEVHNTELRENIQNNEKLKERQTIYFNASNLEAMDVTKSVPFNLVHQNLPVVDKENIQNMEVIQNIATSNVQNNHKLKNRQTIHFNESIRDITESVPYICMKKQHLPAENKENESALYQTKSTTYNETQKEVHNTELRENIQNNEKIKERQTIYFNASNLEAMDVTKSVPFNLVHQNLPVVDKENVQNMEVIQNIATSNVQNNHKQKNRQTIHFNESITDITESVPYICMKKQHLPAENKENESTMYQTKPATYETQKEVHNTELRKNIHTNIQKNEKLKERQTIYFNASNLEAMDVTKSVPFNLVQQNLPVVDKENVQNMEVIQNIVTSNVQNNHKQKNRQTIHFNESITDITESVPYICIKKQNLPAENKENESAMYQTKPATYDETQKEVHNTELRENIHTNIQKNEKLKERQTIYCNVSNLEAMDVTKSVPFNLVHQNLPVADKENAQNMEVTQNIATNIVQNNHNLKSRQTIHFDNSNMGNLDITENVPSNLVQNMTQQLPPKNIEQNVEMKQKECTNVELNTEKLEYIKSFNGTEANLKNIDNTEIVHLMHKNDHQQTLLHEEINNVDITENISHNFTQNREQMRIIFNETNIEKIDITENIPIMLNEIAANIPSSHHINTVLQNEFNTKDNSCNDFTQNEESAQINEIDMGKSDFENVVSKSEQEITNIENKGSKTNNQINTDEQIIEFSQQNCTNFISESVQTIHHSESEIDHIEITETVPANLLQKLMHKSPLEHKENVEQYENPLNVTEQLNLTPVNNNQTFNLTANLTTLVDSTEKLINYQIGLPSSDYSKIITDNVDKNYSIVNTSIPENLDFSDVTISDSGEKMDSIISVNSSTDSVEHVDEFKKMLSKIKPPKIHHFDVDQILTKILPPTIDQEVKLFQSTISSNLSATQRMKNIILNKYNKLKSTETTFNVPIRQLEQEKPSIIFKRIQKLLAEHQQHKEVKKVLTLMDKIKQIATKDKLWFLIPHTEYSFIFMKNIRFDLQIKTDSEIVQSIHSTLDESKLRPVGRFVFEKLKPKLTEEKIKSSIGNNYNIFSFLDYLTQISEECMATTVKELNELISKYGLKIDDNMNATLLFTNTSLLLAFEIKLNLNDLDHIREDLIQINQLICTADENALRRLVKFCPTGIEFIRKYHHSVTDYLKCLQQSKLM